jgi:peroxiredoxin
MRQLFLVCLLLAAAPAPAPAAPSAPAFTVKLLDGGHTFDSRSLIGKKVLVVRFQASWCKVCVEEAPHIERIWARYRRAGVQVVAIQVEDTRADAQRFLRGATYPAGLDPKLVIANRFKAMGTPYTIVIDRKGEIAARISGRSGEARLADVLEPLLKESPQRTPPARLR